MKITEKTTEIIEKERQIMSFTTRCPYYPLVVDWADGVKVTDIDGNEFIDLLASAAVINVGHNHPKVVEAIKDQTDKFIHYTPAYMYHAPHTELAEKLIEITPGDFPKRVAFALSGSGSVDGALKAAKAYTKREHIVSFTRSYHGTTLGALSVSGYGPEMRSGVGDLMGNVHFIPYPDHYRGKTEDECIEAFEELISTVVDPHDIAAVIFEPVQGDGGILMPEMDFFQRLSSICREYGILMIADEVQTGFGRTGKMFASEWFGIEPDILVLGKALAGGMPLSAIVARSEILESWHTPLHFFNTAGNPVCCAAALASINVLETEHVLENTEEVGTYMMKRFLEMKEKHTCIGDVRGPGLMIGVDIVTDKKSKRRDPIMTKKLCWRCWEKGLILAFFSSNVLRVEPPLVISTEEAEQALDIIEESICDVENGLVPDSVLEEIKGW